MGMGQLVVTAVVVEGRSKSEVARDYGISRRWVITLVQRFLAEGEAGLSPRSRRPLRSPTRTATDVEDEIVEIRKSLTKAGHEAGAATIAFHLERRRGTSPALSTIWRVLSERGFVTPQPHKRPKSSYVRFQAEQPNERWQTDITHWALADSSDIEILNVVDDHSRLSIASVARRVFKAADVERCFRDAAAVHGEPASVLSDNGAVFTGRHRGGGRVALEVTLNARGVAFTHSRPYHPQTCGKVERFHQTVKRWLATQPRAASVVRLQAQLDDFRSYYNSVRPHRAVGRRTPEQTYQARPKAGPTGVPLDDRHYRVRHDTVDSNGKLTLRHDSRLHHIGMGRRHARRPVLILVKDLQVRVTTTDGELLRDFELDPSRDYQPQPRTGTMS
jgi:transposase InsO family protein